MTPVPFISALTEEEELASDKVRSVGGGVYFHRESPDLVMEVYFSGPNIRDEHLTLLEPLADRVDWLALDETKITSEGLVHIAKLRNLHTLLLNDTQVDDSALKHLAGLKKLRTLRLDGTCINGSKLRLLMDCHSLAYLCLGRTPVGLVELRALQDHPALDYVDLFRTQEAKENPEWEQFWRNLPIVKQRTADAEARRKRAEEGKKKRGELPYEIVVEVVKVGTDGKETVVYSTDDDSKESKNNHDN